MAYTKKKPRDREELHRDIIQQARDDLAADVENREAALDDLQFCAGGEYQWDSAVYRDRIDAGVPVITVNLIRKFVRQVTNEARKNRPAIKVRPVDDEADPDTAKVLEGLCRHTEDQSEAASKAYIPGIDNAAMCGIGHWRIVVDYVKGSFWQDATIVGIPNALAVLWDKSARDPVRMDAMHCFVFEDMSKDEFEEEYPDKSSSDIESDFWHDDATETVRIAEYWCKEPYEKTLGRTESGQIIDLTDIPAPSVKFLGIVETRKEKCHKVVQYMVSGAEILSGPHEFPSEHIPIIPVIGEELHIGDKVVRSGLVRNAKDPQRLYNLWRSIRAEQLSMQPKAPYMVEMGQVKHPDTQKLFAAANRRNLPYILYNKVEGVPPPQRSAPPQDSSGHMDEILMAAEELKSTTGIYDAALGNRSNETSGVAIDARQRESDTSIMHFEDNLALSIRHTGRILVGVYQVIKDTEQVVRLLNEDMTEAWDRINALEMTPEGPSYRNDLSVGKYDVTVKTGPSYATRRIEAAESMMQFIQTAPDSAQFVLDLVAKNMDWPGADEFAKRFRMMLMKQHPDLIEKNDDDEIPPPSPMDQMNALMMQAEGRKVEAEARKTEADAEKGEMEAAKIGMEVATMAAVGGPLQMAAIQAAMTELQKLLGGQQSQGPEAGMPLSPPPPQPQPAPMGAI